jgi:hypothetical protein
MCEKYVALPLGLALHEPKQNDSDLTDYPFPSSAFAWDWYSDVDDGS